MDEYKQIGSWARGLDWFLTMEQPMFFWVQGEVIYLLFLFAFYPSMKTVYLIGLLIAISTVATIFGYTVKQLIFRIIRWRIADVRNTHSSRDSAYRFLH